MILAMILLTRSQAAIRDGTKPERKTATGVAEASDSIAAVKVATGGGDKAVAVQNKGSGGTHDDSADVLICSEQPVTQSDTTSPDISMHQSAYLMPRMISRIHAGLEAAAAITAADTEPAQQLPLAVPQPTVPDQAGVIGHDATSPEDTAVASSEALSDEPQDEARAADVQPVPLPAQVVAIASESNVPTADDNEEGDVESCPVAAAKTVIDETAAQSDVTAGPTVSLAAATSNLKVETRQIANPAMGVDTDQLDVQDAYAAEWAAPTADDDPLEAALPASAIGLSEFSEERGTTPAAVLSPVRIKHDSLAVDTWPPESHAAAVSVGRVDFATSSDICSSSDYSAHPSAASAQHSAEVEELRQPMAGSPPQLPPASPRVMNQGLTYLPVDDTQELLPFGTQDCTAVSAYEPYDSAEEPGEHMSASEQDQLTATAGLAVQDSELNEDVSLAPADDRARSQATPPAIDDQEGGDGQADGIVIETTVDQFDDHLTLDEALHLEADVEHREHPARMEHADEPAAGIEAAIEASGQQEAAAAVPQLQPTSSFELTGSYGPELHDPAPPADAVASPEDAAFEVHQAAPPINGVRFSDAINYESNGLTDMGDGDTSYKAPGELCL